MRTIAKARPERQIAREKGDLHYFTGRPCSLGHIAKRSTSDASCVECRREMRSGRREDAKAYAKDRRRRMLAADPEGTREKWNESNRQRRLRDPDGVRALDRKHSRLKRQRHPARKLAEVRKRQIDQINRTPPWADLKAIRLFYENCPVGMEVDHIVPLRGKRVSGLHVANNLQYATPLANKIKGNRFLTDWELEL